MKHFVPAGQTDYTVTVFIPDSASTDGSGKTGLVAANLTVSYTRVETDNDVTVTDATSSLNNLAALTTAHTDWGLLEVSSTLAPGLYRLDIADAVFASGAWSAVVYVMVTTSAAAASPMEFSIGPVEANVTTIAANAITATSIAADAITDAKVASDVTIASVTGAVGSVAGAVGSVASGGITSASFSAGAITAAAIATGAVDADAIAADAVTEIQSGLATAAALAVVDGIVDDILVDTAEIGTAGAGLTNINLPNQTMDIVGNITGNLSGSVGSVTGAVGSVTAGVTLAASAVQAIWDALTSALTTVGSIGKLLVDNINATISSRATQTSVDDLPTNAELAASQAAADDATLGAIAALNNLSAAQVNTEVDTALADIHLDHLLATTYDPANKPGAADALLNELVEDDGGVSRYTANALEQAPTGGSAPSVGQIADAVWDEALAGHLIAGSTGEALDAAGSGGGPSAADIADAVWDEATAGHTTSGTFGEQVKTDVDAILADTNELQTDWVNGGRLDNILDARASQTSVDDLPTNAELATALGTADDATLAAIAGLNNLSQANIRTAIGLGSANLDTQLADLPTNAELATALAAADDAVLAAIAALNNLSAAQINAEVVDALATDTYAEPAGPPASTASLKDKIGWLAILARNKVTQTATQQKVRDDDDTVDVGTTAVSDDGTTFTRGEWA